MASDWTLRMLLIAAVMALAGCHISRHIRDLEPVRRPSLTDLERNLTYVDPDDGRSTYLPTR